MLDDRHKAQCEAQDSPGAKICQEGSTLNASKYNKKKKWEQKQQLHELNWNKVSKLIKSK